MCRGRPSAVSQKVNNPAIAGNQQGATTGQHVEKETSECSSLNRTSVLNQSPRNSVLQTQQGICMCIYRGSMCKPRASSRWAGFQALVDGTLAFSSSGRRRVVLFNDITSGRWTTLHGRPHTEDNLGNINWTRWEQEKIDWEEKKVGLVERRGGIWEELGSGNEYEQYIEWNSQRINMLLKENK